jgi:competence protein ComEC
MRIRTLIVGTLWLLAIIVGVFLWVSWQTFQPLRVIFLDVGQGDAILMTEGETQVLIDGGPDGRRLLGKLGRFMPFWDHQIEAVIATHPDADHIGGLASAVRRYQVAQFLSNGAESESGTFQDLKRALVESSLTTQSVLGTGSKLLFPGGGELSVLFPNAGSANTLGETNEGSIVARFRYREASFLLTGDLPHEETALPDIEPTRVLKVAHHGSKYSTSEAWLEKVKPETAIISVGKNRYGHPASEVLDRLRAAHINILRTDESGDIVYVCQEQVCQREQSR